MAQPLRERPKMIGGNVPHSLWSAVRAEAARRGESVSVYIYNLLREEMKRVGRTEEGDA